jgi:RNA polymerase sigma factor (sigma-70 family)
MGQFLGIKSRMAPRPAHEVVRILRTAAGIARDPMLDAVLAGFRRQWLSIARRLRPELADDFEDAVQYALIDLIDPDVLGSLREEAHVFAWARSVFWNKLTTLARDRGRERRRRCQLPENVEHMLDWLANHHASQAPTPEDQAILRERLAIVARRVAALPLARAKFVDDVADKDLALRFGRSPAAVRNYLKRVRHALRAATDEPS